MRTVLPSGTTDTKQVCQPGTSTYLKIGLFPDKSMRYKLTEDKTAFETVDGY